LVRRDAREIVTATLVVAAVLGGFFLLYHFRVVVFLLLAAFVINIAISPAVNWLVARGRSRPLAVALIYLALLTAITLHAGDDNMSATIRRLIRQEARRQGITPADARSLSSAHVCTSS